MEVFVTRSADSDEIQVQIDGTIRGEIEKRREGIGPSWGVVASDYVFPDGTKASDIGTPIEVKDE